MAVTALEQSPTSTMKVDPSSTGKGNDESVGSPPATK